METIFKALSVFGVVNNVIASLRNQSRDAVVHAVCTAIDNKVTSGHFPANFKDGLDTILPAVLNAHPDVPGADHSAETVTVAVAGQSGKAVPAAAATAAPVAVAAQSSTDQKLDALIALMTAQQASKGGKKK